MIVSRYLILITLVILSLGSAEAAHEKAAVTYRIFQFPADRIPRIDGKVDDWDIVPESFIVATDQRCRTFS